MKIGQTEIIDTFAEAFGMTAARVIITADTPALPACQDNAAYLMLGHVVLSMK